MQHLSRSSAQQIVEEIGVRVKRTATSTVAITTTAGTVAPLLDVLGLASPVHAALTVMAIGAGAMTVSHANDSYFWVATNFGEMTPEQGYKTQTMLTLVLGVAAMAEIFLLSLVF